MIGVRHYFNFNLKKFINRYQQKQMQCRQENHRRRKYLDSQFNPKKYSHINNQNIDHPQQESKQHKTKILQTISEQTITEQKGSISNRSQIHQQQQKITKNLSQQLIHPNNHHQNLPLNQIPIKSARYYQNTSQNEPYNAQNLIKNSVFQKKSHRQSIYAQVGNYLHLNDPIKENISNLLPSSYPLKCQQCAYYSYKIQQLQNSYELLLSAKNQQVEECKMIIFGLEEKLLVIQKRSQQQLEKNKKLRAHFERKNIEQTHQKEKENEMMEYLKNRQIWLMEQIKDLQNQMFISKLRLSNNDKTIKSDKYLSKKSSSQSNPVNFNKLPAYINIQHHEQERLKSSISQQSMSEYSANTYKSQVKESLEKKNQIFSQKTFEKQKLNAEAKLFKNQLIERVPLNQVLIKSNQIQSLKDDLLVSQLKTKLQQTKNLQNLYQIR